MNYLTYKEKAFKTIRRQIISNQLPAGEPLNERELAGRLSISKTPIREAILLLHNEGLVRFFPKKGAFVAPVTLDDVREIIQIREGIEPVAAGIAANNCDEKELSDFQNKFKALEKERQKDYQTIRKVGVEFHAFLVSSTKNKRLIDLHYSLDGQMSRARNLFHSNLPLSYYDQTLTELLAIIRAVKKGNGKSAEALMRQHIVDYWKRLKEGA